MALHPVVPVIPYSVAGSYNFPVSMVLDSNGDCISASAITTQTLSSLTVTGNASVGGNLTVTGTVNQGANTFTLPASTGTFALTSQIPAAIFTPSYGFFTSTALSGSAVVFVLNTTPTGSGFGVAAPNINFPTTPVATWQYTYDANVILTTTSSPGSFTTAFGFAPTSSVVVDASVPSGTGTLRLHGSGIINTANGCQVQMTATNIASISSMLIAIVRVG